MPPLILDDSPFKNLPATLPRRTLIFLDGLRVSAEMADVAYRHLEATLLGLMSNEAPVLDGTQVDALVYAWSVVDSLHRFRKILAGTPGLKHNHVYELFVRGTAGVEGIRNAIQHLSGELDIIVALSQNSLGTLRWFGASASPQAPPTVYALNVGTRYPGQMMVGPTIDTLAVGATEPISAISLALSKHELDLTDGMRRLASIVRSLEAAFAPTPAAQKLGADQLAGFELHPLEPEDPAPAV